MSQTRAADIRYLELPSLALVALGGERRGDEIIVTHDRIVIGRASDNDLVLAHKTVSSRHCEVVRDRHGYFVRDLGSANGTRLDGADVREAYLKPGVVLSVGNIELKVRTVTQRIEVLPSKRHTFGEAVGKSIQMRRIFGLLERLAPSEASILISGETGTGKSVLARAIHEQSGRAARPFVVVDCGARVPALIESELFGHERGAFSGATEEHTGAFELADGGTIFLDDIGELPLDLQSKLLRVLQERTFRRIGSEKERRTNVRVIAATKRSLLVDVQCGKFQEDLFFRISIAAVDLPPLRERRDDMPLLIQALVSRIAHENEEAPLHLEADALAALSSHEWPGNIRELHNALARASTLACSAGESALGFRDFPAPTHFIGPRTKTTSFEASFRDDKSYRDVKAAFEHEFERRYVTWLLSKHEGNISAAARAAEMDRKYLHKLAKKHRLR